MAARIRTRDRLVEVLAVEVVIQQGRALRRALLHRLDAAHLLDPLEHEAEDVDAVRGGRVVHGFLVRHGLPVQHDRVLLQRVTPQQVLAHDDDRHARRAHVLLRARVDDAVLGHVHRPRQDVGRHIRHQRHARRGLGVVLVFGAVDGVVRADVEVIRVRTDVQLALRRHMVEVGLLGGERNVDVAELDRFLICVVRKVAGDGVIRLAGLHQVHRDGRELGRRAALQEQDLVVLRDGEHAAQRRLGLLDDAVIYLGAVTHLHDGHAGALVVQHFGRTSLEDGHRKHGRASGKIVDTIVSHSDSYLPFNNQRVIIPIGECSFHYNICARDLLR